MNCLIDTQAFIWFLEDNSNLSIKARNEIADIRNAMFVSIASYWEIGIKSSIGKLRLPEPLSDVMNKAEREAIDLIGIQPPHVLAIEQLPFHHRDPFDRI